MWLFLSFFSLKEVSILFPITCVYMNGSFQLEWRMIKVPVIVSLWKCPSILWLFLFEQSLVVCSKKKQILCFRHVYKSKSHLHWLGVLLF